MILRLLLALCVTAYICWNWPSVRSDWIMWLSSPRRKNPPFVWVLIASVLVLL